MRRNLAQVAAGGKLTVDHVQTAVGVCPEVCEQCAAFPVGNGVGKTVHLTRDQLAANLEREIEGGFLKRVFDVDEEGHGVEVVGRRELVYSSDDTPLGDIDLAEAPTSDEVEYPRDFTAVKRLQRVTPLRIADILNRLVTTDINMEPLRGDGFVDLAELVCELSDGESRVACLTHGLRANRGKVPEDMVERMQRVVDLMQTHVHGKPVIPLFVLTIDQARSRGRISDSQNFKSYLDTLDMLRPVLEQGDDMRPRVTISVQGYNNEEHRLFIGEAENLYQALRRALVEERGWPQELLGRLKRARARDYVRAGRAELLPGLDNSGRAPVIPDSIAAERMVDGLPQWVGFMDALGRVQRRDRDTNRMYNKLVEKGRRPGEGTPYWRPCANGVDEIGWEDAPLDELTLNSGGRFTGLLTPVDGGPGPGPGSGGGGGDVLQAIGDDQREASTVDNPIGAQSLAAEEIAERGEQRRALRVIAGGDLGASSSGGRRVRRMPMAYPKGFGPDRPVKVEMAKGDVRAGGVQLLKKVARG